jgi:hypothetical protein
MLFHIRPRLCSEFNLVRLLSVTVQPLGLELVGEQEVRCRLREIGGCADRRDFDRECRQG